MTPKGRLACVWGLGRFGGGAGAIRFLRRRGLRVRVLDKSPADNLAETVREFHGDDGIEWCLGSEDPEHLTNVDLVVVNPAIPDSHPLLQAIRRAGIPRTQEIELFLSAYPGDVVWITGTNGKSTTSSLLHRALTTAGIPALLGGNIGRSLLDDEDAWPSHPLAVVEISSFQLSRLDLERIQPVRGAILTTIGADHLDRHGSLLAYRAAKSVAAAHAEEFLIHDAADPVAETFYSPAHARVRVSTQAPPTEGRAGCDDGWLTLPDRLGGNPLIHGDALPIGGGPQQLNALLAGTAAAMLGAPAHPIGLALASATPLPHRLQLCFTSGGIRVYDNGVSTGAASTVAALQSLRDQLGARPGARIHWLGGGASKGENLHAVAQQLLPALAGAPSVAWLFGAVAEPLREALVAAASDEPRLDEQDGPAGWGYASAPQQPAAETGGPWHAHKTMEDAIRAVFAASRDGDIVLFSPAFASFDAFTNFRARAATFQRLARECAPTTPGSSPEVTGTVAPTNDSGLAPGEPHP